MGRGGQARWYKGRISGRLPISPFVMAGFLLTNSLALLVLPMSAVTRWSQPVDATPILNRRDRDYVLMSEKCRQGLTAAEKPELWHRWQPGILKAIRRAFGKRYAGVASTG